MVVPYVDVYHLPSSVSFYSSVLQPLGWYYADCGRASEPERSVAVEFGLAGAPILRIRQAALLQSRVPLTNIEIEALSRETVKDFHNRGVRANPALQLPTAPSTSGAFSSSERNFAYLSKRGGQLRAMLHDLDGNRLEVVCPEVRPAGGNVKYSGTPVRQTQSTEAEVGRILNWNYNVASSSPRAAPGSVMSRRHSELPGPLRRSLTHGSQPLVAERSQPEVSSSPRQGSASGGLNATTVVGALLGMAAGAALTYGAFSKDSSRGSSREDEQAPPIPRRSTFPELPKGTTYTQHHGQTTGVEDSSPREYAYSSRGLGKGDLPDHNPYVDGWSKPRTASDNPWQHDSALSRVSRGSKPPRARAIDDDHEGLSRHSTRYNGGRASEVRTRSAGPSDGEPLALTGLGRRSLAAASRHSGGFRSSAVVPEQDHDTYVSARTHKTSSTPRPPLSRPHTTEFEPVRRSRASSRSSATRKPSVPAGSPPARSHSDRPASYVSARNVPLPMSGVGSSHANWDDDLDSVVPDDSISCVGSKSSRRSRR